MQAEEAGSSLSEDELFATVVLLLIAGHENVTGLLGCGTLALLQHPDQLERLRAQPALLKNAVDELLRYVTPNQFIRRVALEDLTIGDKQIRQGQACSSWPRPIATPAIIPIRTGSTWTAM